MKKIYLAGPLFSEAERAWHRTAKSRIEAEAEKRKRPVEVIWPYERMTREEIEALGGDAREQIFVRCREDLGEADILVALLDGSQVDDGTAWEVGYFFGTKGAGADIIGVRTDFRKAGETVASKVNAMIEVACTQIVGSMEELLSVLSRLG